MLFRILYGGSCRLSAKLCKYECGTLITWDNSKRVFLEQDGTPHGRERCAVLKEKIQPSTDSAKGKAAGYPDLTLPSNESKLSGMADVAAAIRELAAAIRSRPI